MVLVRSAVVETPATLKSNRSGDHLSTLRQRVA